ncbi:hypothetical protein [Snuella sedimenti]|uniref:Uncharacterized protein n=1 Tax=Snuella sedimenti TaxID=2798802 RepID=A0A8J7IUA1_9FLAO|nr:hypothetical protein [Snuella sedimenti]MBJ6366745.1 hypothetical protein [Snuella sedimenti]
MRIFTIILSFIAIGLIILNATKIDLSHPFEGESIIALITIVASLCAISLMAILRISKRIEQKTKEKN